MSLEQHAFVRRSNMPTREDWQARISELGFGVELDPEMKVGDDKGFSPCTIKGQASGFEIYFESPEEVLASYPDIRESISDRDCCVTFRWGGDLLECVCVLVVSAALAKFFDAVVYYPHDAIFYSPDELLAEATSCLEE